jgi:hypothetical protein
MQFWQTYNPELARRLGANWVWTDRADQEWLGPRETTRMKRRLSPEVIHSIDGSAIVFFGWPRDRAVPRMRAGLVAGGFLAFRDAGPAYAAPEDVVYTWAHLAPGFQALKDVREVVLVDAPLSDVEAAAWPTSARVRPLEFAYNGKGKHYRIWTRHLGDYQEMMVPGLALTPGKSVITTGGGITLKASFAVEKAARYRVMLRAAQGPRRVPLVVRVDGAKVGIRYLRANAPTVVWGPAGDVDLRPGRHTLEITTDHRQDSEIIWAEKRARAILDGIAVVSEEDLAEAEGLVRVWLAARPLTFVYTRRMLEWLEPGGVTVGATELSGARFYYGETFEPASSRLEADARVVGFSRRLSPDFAWTIRCGRPPGTSHLTYRLASDTPFTELKAEWDTALISPERKHTTGRVLASPDGETWKLVQAIVEDHHPLQVDLTDEARGARELFVRFEIEAASDRPKDRAYVLKTGFEGRVRPAGPVTIRLAPGRYTVRRFDGDRALGRAEITTDPEGRVVVPMDDSWDRIAFRREPTAPAAPELRGRAARSSQ